MWKRRLRFYLLRLKHASIAEIIYRAKQEIFILQLKHAVKQGRRPFQIPEIDPADIEGINLPTFDPHFSEDTIKEILRVKTFSLNTDPWKIREFEERYRSSFFSDIKPTDSDPDIRAVWEPSRLQHLTILLIYCLQNPSLSQSSPSHRLQQIA